MSNSIVTNIDGQLLVDSRLIAERLGIQHKNLLATIKKYADDFKEFGHLAFETQAITHTVSGKTNQEIFVYLNENQATYLMTLSKNTEQVRFCKRELVSAFSKAKQLIATVIPAQSDRLKELLAEKELLQLKCDMATMHGKEYAALTLGGAGAVVYVEVPTIEIIDDRHNVAFKGQTLVQLRDFLAKTHNVKFKSGADLQRALEKAGYGHLIAQTLRSVTGAYIPMEHVNEAISVVTRGDRQTLIGEK
jgi:anti-repressor protein